MEIWANKLSLTFFFSLTVDKQPALRQGSGETNNEKKLCESYEQEFNLDVSPAMPMDDYEFKKII